MLQKVEGIGSKTGSNAEAKAPATLTTKHGQLRLCALAIVLHNPAKTGSKSEEEPEAIQQLMTWELKYKA